MHKFIAITFLVAIFVSAENAIAANELERLDQMRTGGETVKVETVIEVYENGTLDRASRLDVYVGGDRRSLAVYRSEREAGQKVLMLGDKFWLFLPSSKRAMRITAMQKMMGEASVGDVASLNWSEDYRIVEQTMDGGFTKLRLQAARKGLSYDTIDLWVDAETGHPKKADLFLKSGKLAKQAEFGMAKDETGQWRIVSLALQDKVRSNQLTKIVYASIEPLDVQDKWFTPNFLLRSAP